MKKFILILSTLMLIFSLSVPVFAEEASSWALDKHSICNVVWEYDGTSYYLMPDTGVGVEKDIPLYVTWDDQIVFITDQSDAKCRQLRIHEVGGASGAKVHVFDGVSYTRADGTLAYVYRIPTNFTDFGLNCSTLQTLRNSLDSSVSSLYYLDNMDTSWGDAVNFSLPSLGMTMALEERMEAQLPAVGMEAVGMMKTVLPYGVGLLALLIILPVLLRTFRTFLR